MGDDRTKLDAYERGIQEGLDLRDELRQEIARLREALLSIASYHEHGKFSALSPAWLARIAQKALDNAGR
jgi:hypothetical protein